MDEKLNYYMNLPYTIEFQNDPEYGWHARVKELPGCMNQGDSPEEALEAILDTMQGWLEIALEKGNPIPEPRHEEDYSGKFVVRVPKSLHRKLVEEAEREGVSLNQYINVTLAGSVAGNMAIPKKSAIVGSEEDINWPGLSKATKEALRMAGQTDEAGDIDERLFSSWLSENMMQITSALRLNNFPEAHKYFDYLIVILRQNMNCSPIFENLVSLLESQKRMIRHIGDSQGLPVEESFQPQLIKYIQDVNQPSVKSQFVISGRKQIREQEVNAYIDNLSREVPSN